MPKVIGSIAIDQQIREEYKKYKKMTKNPKQNKTKPQTKQKPKPNQSDIWHNVVWLLLLIECIMKSEREWIMILKILNQNQFVLFKSGDNFEKLLEV